MDHIIEQEAKLEAFQTTNEVDGVLKEYMEVLIQFTSISFFGVSFPLSLTLGYLTMVSQIGIDQYKLVKFYRRPIPKGARDIGTWQVIIDIISFLSIFINAGLITYNSKSFDSIIEIITEDGLQPEEAYDLSGPNF